MDLSQLRPAPGATRERKRVGRGNAAGKGTTAGRGQKGAGSRSGKQPHAGFEGGQYPLYRRLARKRGFINRFRVEYEPVNVGELAKFDANTVVTPEALLSAGLVKRSNMPVKVLATGELDRALTVRAHKFSDAARQKIEAAGGRIEALDGEGEPAVGRPKRNGRDGNAGNQAEAVSGNGDSDPAE